MPMTDPLDAERVRSKTRVCPDCAGRGVRPDGSRCGNCGGSGTIEV